MSIARRVAVFVLATVGAGTAQGAARFMVGASVADITPPLAASATSNPADCDVTGTFDGPHLFSLEEPYQDLNGNGRYDSTPDTGDPARGSTAAPQRSRRRRPGESAGAQGFGCWTRLASTFTTFVWSSGSPFEANITLPI